MGSLQQITMGIVCLVAAFWFGSFLQEQPAGQSPTAALLPDGTIDPTQTANPSNLIESTKGFLSSLFESQEQTKPVTVADLRQRSQAATDRNQKTAEKFPGDVARSPIGSPNTAISPLGIQDTLPVAVENVTPIGGPFANQTPATQVANKVAIVPDFSSLADEVNRGLSFNDRPTARPRPNSDASALLPVPNFSNADVLPRDSSPEMDWDALRQRVADAESRLKTHRNQMTQPIPAIQESVTQQTREFQNRQQPRPRPQPLPLANDDRQSLRQRQPTPETWNEKKSRWDVFSQRSTGLTRQEETQSNRFENRPAANSNDSFGQRSNAIARRQETFGQRPAQTQTQTQTQVQAQTQIQTQSRIVEVDRGFVSQPYNAASNDANLNRPVPRSSARVRSLNDDRDPATGFTGDRVASNGFNNGPRVQNQLRPKYDPNPGSDPEFVSPPNYDRFRQQPAASVRSGSPQSQGQLASEIVEDAKGSYGSFREYETQPGDTLQTISIKFYGTADYYFDLYLANRSLLRNPASVAPGKTIKIPRFDVN